MAKSSTTSTSEAIKSAPIPKPPVPEVDASQERTADASSTFGQQAVNAVGGGSVQTPPRQFGAYLGQMQGAPARQKGVLRQLQRSYGNQYVGQVIQAKLTVGQPGDVYEEEADRVADAVMRMPEPSVSPSASVSAQIHPLLIQRMCTECREEEEEERIHPKEAPRETPTVTPALESRLNASSSSGQPLPKSVRAFMEPRFGTDFSSVRVHAGSEAGALNRELKSQAFTQQRDIYFGVGKYNPWSSEGRHLLAHELTHVAQQEKTDSPLISKKILAETILLFREPRSTSQSLDPRLLSNNELYDEVQAIRSWLIRTDVSEEQKSRLREVLSGLETEAASRGVTLGRDVSALTEGDLAIFYRKASALSSGLEVLENVLRYTHQAINREQSDWYIFSDRTYTRPVVLKIIREADLFRAKAQQFLDSNIGVDQNIESQLQADITSFVRTRDNLRNAAPENIGDIEVGSRRLSGGIIGAAGAFLGFLRLGLWDSWGQFVFEGSERRINEAQEGLSSLMLDIDRNGFFDTLGTHASAWTDELEQAERFQRYSSSGQQFGSAAFNIYFVGRGLFSGVRGAVQLNRAAQAFRAMGHSAPWRAAVVTAGREMIAFRGIGVHRGAGFWGSQRGMASMGETVDINRVISSEIDLTSKHWRPISQGGSQEILMPEGGRIPTLQDVARGHMSSSTGSPLQSAFPMKDIQTYILANPQNWGVAQGRAVVTVRVPTRGLVSANQLELIRKGMNPAAIAEFERSAFGARIPSPMRPTSATAEGYLTEAYSTQVLAWVEKHLGIANPAAVRALEGIPYYEWEQLILAPSFRPYIVRSVPNPLAESSGTSPLTISSSGRMPIYHPALNPQTVYHLAASQPGGWQSFAGYVRWLNAGAAGELGFIPTEIAGFERMTLLGGGPLATPFLPYPYSVGSTPGFHAPSVSSSQNISERQFQGYLQWITQQEGNRLIRESAGEYVGRAAPNRERLSLTQASQNISNIAARLRSLGASIEELRVGPRTVYLRARVPANVDAIRQMSMSIISLWTMRGEEINAGIDLVTGITNMEQQTFLDLTQSLNSIRVPQNLTLQIRP